MASREFDLKLLEKYPNGLSQSEAVILINHIWDDIQSDLDSYIKAQKKLSKDLADLGISYYMSNSGIITINK